ncbi:hypothetical protein KAR91_23520 [Candidatus Pacearchaeota archaeon]|nr:hypothetical protein [Candidatus Pacearchaeota archaeon]
MPILVPYGDPQTHGTLGKSITFRRWRGKVIAEKKPRVKQPNTSAQLQHRARFKEAWKEWFLLNLWELQYLQIKSAQKAMTPSNLWIQMYLKQITWSKVQNNIVKQITDMNLPAPISDVDEGIEFTYFGAADTAPPPKDMGAIWDAENNFDPGFTMSPYEYSYIEIQSPLVTPFNVPFDYPLLINWTGFDDVEHIQLIKFPELPFPKNETPSTTQMNKIKKLDSVSILQPISTGLTDIQFHMETGPSIGSYPNLIGRIFDNENILYNNNESPINAVTKIGIENETGEEVTIPEGYIIQVTWTDFADLQYQDAIYLPEIILGDSESIDLYFADDWSVYYDDTLTILANSPIKPGPYKLYLASDFSLYWDKNLSMLANTPIL